MEVTFLMTECIRGVRKDDEYQTNAKVLYSLSQKRTRCREEKGERARFKAAAAAEARKLTSAFDLTKADAAANEGVPPTTVLEKRVKGRI